MSSPVQIVAAGALVRREDGKVLLVKHRRRGWEFPGGQVENGEGPDQGALREVLEETGVEARVTGLSGIFATTTGHRAVWGEDLPPILNIDFRCEYVSGEARVSEEHEDIGWFAPDEALRLVTHPRFRVRLEAMLRPDGSIPVYRAPYGADHFEGERLRAD